jgi:hypothetical protein
MRLPTNLRKSHLVEPRFHLTFSQGTFMNLPLTLVQQRGSITRSSTPHLR